MEESNILSGFPRLRLRRRDLLQAGVLGATGLSLPALLEACGGTSSPSSTTPSGEGSFPSHPTWNFVFVNHVTTNPFFVPTQYGASDACALVGCKYQWTGSANSIVADMVNAMNTAYQWTGSANSIVADMVNAMNTAIAGKVDGIAVSIIDPVAFNAPVEAALSAGIPVLAYNADAPATSKNARMAYIGQNLFASGQAMGTRITSLVTSGLVAGFIATPGSLNIEPRIDGAKSVIQASGLPIQFVEIATGAAVNDELSRIDAYYLGHPNLKGMFAVDGGSTQSTGQIMEKYSLTGKGVHAGGFDLEPVTLQEVQKGNLDFTIDQQPYLQGFIPVLQLFLYKLSGGLMAPSDTNTGLLFVTKNNVGPYLNTQTRFEGSSSAQKVVSP